MSKDKDTPKHGYASFSKDDTEDAKRGEPAGTLDTYAAARGLTPMGQVKLTAFRGVLPAWPDYIFNVVRGVLPGGAIGVLEHELQEVPTDPSRGILWGGTFYDTHYTAKGPKGFLSKILPFELSVDEPKAAFEASALWVPVTATVVRVPETALLPYMVVRPKDFLRSVTRRSTMSARRASGSSGSNSRPNCAPPCSVAPSARCCAPLPIRTWS
jgi:hypothetical protein